ncbi:TetR/AcrR family transcriptional regulator C-terminal domain-containing protein [Nocardioides aurantiacus]|uniref:TetR family transcriptional regulator n=1 Tax=Nocardioides aurantiacus TaxID=86796 RepID=A0A3N2CZM4_9ACTN|nr:TetR/AcrR family transcriptional regulator C-terminal domain-containing protein [Nocardioides aurantiacus]ROR92987.1 TetR family transcriptional regulator [Nocardioides aurantiacus]
MDATPGSAPGPDAVPDADAAVVAGEPVPSDRIALDRDRILAAALAHIDEQGLAGLTMRRLGHRVGVEAMSLYRYVPGKEELLDGVVELLIGDLRMDPDVLHSPTHGWQDFLQRLAHGVRRVALAHPRAFPLVASRPPEAPWLRPPLRSLEWVDAFLSGLLEEGFSDEAAVAAYRSFTSFLLGTLLLEVSAHGADVGPLDVVDDHQADDVEASRHATVWRLRHDLAHDASASEFEVALEALLERLTLIRSELG